MKCIFSGITTSSHVLYRLIQARNSWLQEENSVPLSFHDLVPLTSIVGFEKRWKMALFGHGRSVFFGPGDLWGKCISWNVLLTCRRNVGDASIARGQAASNGGLGHWQSSSLLYISNYRGMLFIGYTAAILSGFFLSEMSIDRLLAVRYPMSAKIRCTTGRATKTIILTVAVLCLLNTHIFVFYTYEKNLQTG